MFFFEYNAAISEILLQTDFMRLNVRFWLTYPYC